MRSLLAAICVLGAGGCSVFDVPTIAFAEVRVTDDNNKDGVLNPGETAWLVVSVQNTGAGSVSGVRLTLSTTSQFATVETTSGAYCGMVMSSDTSCGHHEITVSENAPSGTPISFDAVAEDEDGKEWSFSFVVDVFASGAQPSIERVLIKDDSNKDGVLNPGEKAWLEVTVRNVGLSQLDGLKGVLVAESLAATIEDGEMYCYSVKPDAQSSCQSVAVEIGGAAVPGIDLRFRADFEDEVGATWSLPFSVPLSASGALPELQRVEVRDDDNQDGVLNPGEKAQIRITLVNHGSAEINGAKGTLSTETADIEFASTDPLYCYNLDPGKSDTCQTSSITVLQTAELEAQHTFKLVVVDNVGASWNLAFTLPVLATAAQPIVTDYEAALVPGKTAAVKVTLQNAGVSILNSPRLALQSKSAQIEVKETGPMYCGSDLDPWEITLCTGINVAVDSGVANGAPAAFNATVTDKQGNSWSFPLELTVGE